MGEDYREQAMRRHRRERNRRRLKPHVVYVLATEDGAVLYVGCTVALDARLTAHHSKPWWPEVACVETEEFGDQYMARYREAKLIRELDPPGNYIGTSRHSERTKAHWRAWREKNVADPA